MKFQSGLSCVAKNPIESIMFLISLAFLAYFAYYALPMSLDANGIISEVFNTIEEHVFISLALGWPSGYALYSLIRKDKGKLHNASFWVFLSGLFLTALRIATFGLSPWTGWVLLLTPALVAGVCYLYLGYVPNGKK